ncbi:transporter suffix domain-containing protein [Bacillus sp. FJAT-49711]|uniref:transporter suffix domain-containing protein n=1 Tax=Bacillus sp. FJAT-49711 TaxID=2833585 RepID=UPI001BC9DB4A|nr:transporter suffix domain-containing protein [Bacillus sp. FJAT-49711]MBS4220110.1 transporter suffix domain-containing protein [Bacillus sp. FJAT-49711]
MEKDIVSNGDKQKKSFLFKLGIGLLILYPILWGFAAIVPFTPFPTHLKATVITVCIVVGEILFLIGAAFVGKEVVTKYKSKLNPKNWRRKGDKQKDEE